MIGSSARVQEARLRARRAPAMRACLRLVPGLAAVAAVVAVAYGVSAVAGIVSPLIAAIAIGAIAAPVARRRGETAPGIRLAGRTLLRAGIVLLGLRVSAQDIASLGLAGVAVALTTVIATLAVSMGASRLLGVGRTCAWLVATGSAICGASAVAAVGSALRADEDDVGYAIVTVTLFGTLAMVLTPVVATELLGLTDRQAGLLVGASIHEVAQVTAAGAIVSTTGLAIAVLVKLTRVVLLAPTVAVIGLLERRGSGASATPVPAFVVGFLALVALRSLVDLPIQVLDGALLLSTVLLAAGLAALGLQIHVAGLRAAGWRPMALGLVAWLVAAGTSLVAIVVLNP